MILGSNQESGTQGSGNQVSGDHGLGISGLVDLLLGGRGRRHSQKREKEMI